MPLEQLVPMIKFWLIKNISRKPQIIRSKEIKNGMLVMNPGSQEWVNCAVHQQVMDTEWCKTITNDVDYDASIRTGEVEVALPKDDEYVTLRQKDVPVGVYPDAQQDPNLPLIFKRTGLADSIVENPDAEDGESETEPEHASYEGNDDIVVIEQNQSGKCPQCAGIKGDGTRCGRAADAGSEYCYLHKPQD